MIRQHNNGTEFTFPNGYAASTAFYAGRFELTAAGLEAEVVHLVWWAYGGAIQHYGLVDATELMGCLQTLANLPTIKPTWMERFKEYPPRYDHNRLGAVFLGRYDRIHLAANVTDDLWYQDGKVYARWGHHHADLCDNEQEPNHPAIKAALSRATSLGLMPITV